MRRRILALPDIMEKWIVQAPPVDAVGHTPATTPDASGPTHRVRPRPLAGALRVSWHLRGDLHRHRGPRRGLSLHRGAPVTSERRAGPVAGVGRRWRSERKRGRRILGKGELELRGNMVSKRMKQPHLI